MNHRLFGVTGWKNSGKTTLIVRLVEELTRRGFVISTIKHAHHAFDIDHAGTDSWRHREAGAGEVAIVSGRRWALMHESRDGVEPPLHEIVARLAPCDLVLIEGYKREPHDKIEARRTGSNDRGPLADGDASIVAIASDHDTDATGRPSFRLDDVVAIADFILAHTGLPARR